MSEMIETVGIAANLAEVQRQIAEVQRQIVDAARGVHRDPNEIRLVAVSKTKPMSAIQAAYAAGQRDFGENRLEELWPKVEEARTLGLTDIRWHLIGTIQSRKTREAVGPFVLIHSVERNKIAERISRDAQAAGNVMSVLLEVNVSGEESKHGFTPAELLETAGDLLKLPGICIEGLMTMAPLVEDPEAARPVFRQLRKLRDQLRQRYPQVAWQELSMGMTNDFTVAIAEGATLVRIGSAIFGSR